jgi:AbrB family looped-hinge helix DNA binding protein
MTKGTISPEGQVLIPKAVRENLNLQAGTQVSIDVQGDVLVMKRFAGSYPDWRTMQGMASGEESLTAGLEEEHREELAREDARIESL